MSSSSLSPSRNSAIGMANREWNAARGVIGEGSRARGVAREGLMDPDGVACYCDLEVWKKRDRRGGTGGTSHRRAPVPGRKPAERRRDRPARTRQLGCHGGGGMLGRRGAPASGHGDTAHGDAAHVEREAPRAGVEETAMKKLGSLICWPNRSR
jgi:hypothetical protein